MVTTGLYLSIEIFYVSIHVQQQIMKLQHVVYYYTLRLGCILHLSNIKHSRIVNIARQPTPPPEND